MAETVQKETLQMKPVEAWYRGKVERLMAAREKGKEGLEALYLGELRMGPGDLSLAEWEQKEVEDERRRHGERAYDAVFGSGNAKAEKKH